ncbi:hypothetical protein BV20DRAFT_823362 [Pilatotrama ljubarskyi]|nr:hypothetical protein BV20DRAFT_823362 [Pilatotrama ljubarskyi]
MRRTMPDMIWIRPSVPSGGGWNAIYCRDPRGFIHPTLFYRPPSTLIRTIYSTLRHRRSNAGRPGHTSPAQFLKSIGVCILITIAIECFLIYRWHVCSPRPPITPGARREIAAGVFRPLHTACSTFKDSRWRIVTRTKRRARDRARVDVQRAHESSSTSKLERRTCRIRIPRS